MPECWLQVDMGAIPGCFKRKKVTTPKCWWWDPRLNVQCRKVTMPECWFVVG